jgi:HK97 family phage major capsid protein
VISGSNASGQVKGLISAAGTTVTYTDATPTVGELYPKLADAVNAIHTNIFRNAEAIVMHPRRWYWILAALDTTNRPLAVPNPNYQGFNPIAVGQGAVAQGVAGTLLGLPVYLDANIPTDDGVGTDQDVVLVLRASEHVLYESSLRTRVLPDVGSGTLTVRLQLYSYLAFTAERYAKATTKITGTGLIAPTF